MRNTPPLDPIERRVLAGLSQTWSSEHAAFIASCSPSLIRRAARDGQLEAIRRIYYRNTGPKGRILRRVRWVIPDWALRAWMAANFFKPTADGTRWKQRPGRKRTSPSSPAAR